MKRIVTSILGVALLMTLSATLSSAANTYPPGPPYRTCPDTLSIFDIQQADTLIAPCHPVVSDTVLGIRGIVVGADVRGSAYATFFTTAGAGDYESVQAFTGSTNYASSVPASPSGGNLTLGDEIVVYGTVQEYPASDGTTEIEGPDVVQSTDDIVIRKVSSGNPVPISIVSTADVNWLPAFSQGEKYEDGLVRIRGPLKVGRTASGPGIFSGNYLLTTVAPSTDSVLIDNYTLSPTLGGPAPPVGTIVDSVQGIVNQNTSLGVNSYRIQLRDGNDIFLAVPPNMADAYPIENNQIRVVFDRDVDQTTAETASNYSLASAIDGSTVDNATMESVPGNVVILTITSVLNPGDTETLGVQGVGSAACPSCLISPEQQATFINGVLTCAQIQAPDPANLSLFDDRSRFAGAGALAGTKLTFRCIQVHKYGSVYYTMDEAGGVRGGVSLYGPTTPLVDGHRYRITGQVQEYQGETEVINTAYITDEGTGTVPDGLIKDVSVLADTTTDMSGTPANPGGSLDTGEDYECMLVKLYYVRVTETRAAGQSFFVAGQKPAYGDTILVSNLSGQLNGYTPPDSASTVDVTGVLHFSGGSFRVCPRGPSDIVDHGLNVGVGGTPGQISFSIAPNPARVSNVLFSLPRASRVELGVYDLQGRQVAQLARGNFDPGTYVREWKGLDAAGNRMNPGVYFYRLKVGSELRTLRGVLLQ